MLMPLHESLGTTPSRQTSRPQTPLIENTASCEKQYERKSALFRVLLENDAIGKYAGDPYLNEEAGVKEKL